MRQVFALTLGLTFLAGCTPAGAPNQVGTNPAPHASAPATGGSLSANEQAMANALGEEAANVASMYADMEQGEGQADSEMNTAATASVGFTRTADVQITPNDDGSTTRTLTLSRTGAKGLVRHMTVETTRKLGQLVSRKMTLTISHPNGRTRSAERTVTVNEDKSRTVATKMTLTLADGRTRTIELTGTRALGEGAASYTATGTLTRFDGKVIQLSVNRQASGDVTVTSSEDGVTVTATADASGDVTATQASTSDGHTAAIVVDTEA